MTDQVKRPLLFLDVDFTASSVRPRPAARADRRSPHPHLARLNPEVGIRLAALPCELVWATPWEDEANAEIAPRIGLPRLPVVNWPQSSAEHEYEDQWFGLHWKTRALVQWAARRSFAWIDDEITDADRDWVSMHHHGQALLHHVDSSRGLDDTDFTALDTWLRAR